MPTYRIEQYELHVLKYHVEADDEAAAIAKLFMGDGEPIDDSLEFVAIADDYGMSLTENQALATQLWERRVIESSDTIIPSVRSVEKVR